MNSIEIAKYRVVSNGKEIRVQILDKASGLWISEKNAQGHLNFENTNKAVEHLRYLKYQDTLTNGGWSVLTLQGLG